MRTPLRTWPMLAAACVLLPASSAPWSGAFATPEAAPGARRHPTLEVARFEVDRDNYSTKELERAGKIPEEILDGIQRALLGEFTRAAIFETVRKPAADAVAEDRILVLGGRITDYKAGNRLARHLVGLGAGQQKIEVECVLKDRATGEVVGREIVIDRKVAGWAGGSEDKGVEDFAQKVLEFVKKTLEPR